MSNRSFGLQGGAVTVHASEGSVSCPIDVGSAVPQTISGHNYRTRSIANIAAEIKWARDNFPEVKEFFFDDDTFAWGKARTIDLCEKLKPINFTWSCTCRVHADYEMLKAMMAECGATNYHILRGTHNENYLHAIRLVEEMLHA